MTDEELAEFIAPDDPRAMEIVAKLSSQDRQQFEYMAYVADELNAGRIPPGVII